MLPFLSTCALNFVSRLVTGIIEFQVFAPVSPTLLLVLVFSEHRQGFSPRLCAVLDTSPVVSCCTPTHNRGGEMWSTTPFTSAHFQVANWIEVSQSSDGAPLAGVALCRVKRSLSIWTFKLFLRPSSSTCSYHHRCQTKVVATTCTICTQQFLTCAVSQWLSSTRLSGRSSDWLGVLHAMVPGRPIPGSSAAHAFGGPDASAALLEPPPWELFASPHTPAPCRQWDAPALTVVATVASSISPRRLERYRGRSLLCRNLAVT